MILKYVASKSRFFCDFVNLNSDSLNAFYFIRTIIDAKRLSNEEIDRQKVFLCDYLFDKNDFLQGSITDMLLTSKGWGEVGKIEKEDNLNKNIFVAMSFAYDAKPIRDAIKKGIRKAGFVPILIDEVTHNKQIVPEMFRLIRESKFLVMDTTLKNYGAYYEAGYAQGLGKEVIITCREDEFNSSDKRPHFDIAQKQILVWKNEEDLIQRLSDWIKALI